MAEREIFVGEGLDEEKRAVLKVCPSVHISRSDSQRSTRTNQKPRISN